MYAIEQKGFDCTGFAQNEQCASEMGCGVARISIRRKRQRPRDAVITCVDVPGAALNSLDPLRHATSVACALRGCAGRDRMPSRGASRGLAR